MEQEITRIEASPGLARDSLDPLRGVWELCEAEGRIRHEHDPLRDLKSSEALVEYLMGLLGQIHWVIFILWIDETPSGFLIAEHQLGTFKKRPIIHSSDLFVVAEQRRKGFGRAVKEDLEAYALSVNASRIISETGVGNFASRGLNLECGYVGTLMEPHLQEIAHLMIERLGRTHRITMVKELDKKK